MTKQVDTHPPRHTRPPRAGRTPVPRHPRRARGDAGDCWRSSAGATSGDATTAGWLRPAGDAAGDLVRLGEALARLGAAFGSAVVGGGLKSAADDAAAARQVGSCCSTRSSFIERSSFVMIPAPPPPTSGDEAAGACAPFHPALGPPGEPGTGGLEGPASAACCAGGSRVSRLISPRSAK